MIRSVLALAVLAIVTESTAQNVKDKENNFALKVDVELVQVPVSVFDKRGVPFRGLLQDHFAIYEDKIQQDISIFKEEDAPLSIDLVIDASQSMTDKQDRLQAAAMTFIRKSNPDDETAILSFNENVVLEQGFTRKHNELSNALSGISYRGSTALYDAAYQAAKHLEDNGTNERKVVLLITDGEDNKSRYSLQEALRAVSESKVSVYTIGLLGQSDYILGNGTAKKALKQFAEVTGGASYFPKNMNEVDAICTKIASDLRAQYTIGYRPSNRNLDGSWRSVVVRLNPPKKTGDLRVRTTKGYYAPGTVGNGVARGDSAPGKSPMKP